MSTKCLDLVIKQGYVARSKHPTPLACQGGTAWDSEDRSAFLYFWEYCSRPVSRSGKPNSKLSRLPRRPFRATNRRRLTKSQAQRQLTPRVIRPHLSRTTTRTKQASGCNRPRTRARLQKGQRRSAATEATALAKAVGERVHIMVAWLAGFDSTAGLVLSIETDGERHSLGRCRTQNYTPILFCAIGGPLISRNAKNPRENQLYSLEWKEQSLEIYSLTLQRTSYRWRYRRHIHDDDLGRG
jgi:hypothetical protein